MYERLYGLKEKPFNLTPDPEFLYMADQHKRAMEQVLYGIRRREGFALLVGDVGTGKTTLCWALLGKLETNVRSALVLNPLLGEEDMLRAIIQDFGVEPRLDGRCRRPPDAGRTYDPTWMKGLSRKELVDELNAFLLDGAELDEFCVVIVDEAQDLSVGVLEQLRLLSNLETAKKKLLQIIFVGQLEFEEKLKQPLLRSLNQRISVRHRIQPLSKPDVRRYIEHRLKVAGASPRLAFTAPAISAIFSCTKGYPRLVNLVCDRALLAASSEMQFYVEARFVRKAARALRGAGVTGGFVSVLRRFARTSAAVGLLATLTVVFSAARGALHLGRGSGAERERSPAAVAAESSAERPSPSETPPKPIAPAARSVETGAVPAAPSPPEDSPAALPERSMPSVSKAPLRRFVVQVHSLVSEEDSAKAVQSLQESGYSAFSRQIGAWHTVCIGPFDHYAAAENVQRSLLAHSSRPTIVRRASD